MLSCNIQRCFLDAVMKYATLVSGHFSVDYVFMMNDLKKKSGLYVNGSPGPFVLPSATFVQSPPRVHPGPMSTSLFESAGYLW